MRLEPINGEEQDDEARGCDEGVANSNIHVGQIKLCFIAYKISIVIQNYFKHITWSFLA